jgi:hypothetical protein
MKTRNMLDIPKIFVPCQPGASTPKIANLFSREPLEPGQYIAEF